MKYLFLAYGDEKHLDAMSTGEREALANACLANDEALRKSGHLLDVQGLQPGRSAITVRVQNGKVSVTDGPCAEPTEQLIGIFFINARDLNEAIQVAATMPQGQSRVPTSSTGMQRTWEPPACCSTTRVPARCARVGRCDASRRARVGRSRRSTPRPGKPATWGRAAA